MKKKVGTVLEESLLFEAKKASLEDRVSFQQLLEKALEKFLRERPRVKARGASRASRIEEKGTAFLPREDVSFPPAPSIPVPPAYPSCSLSFGERWNRALSFSGKYRSGRSDISARHDEFAAEAYGE